MAGHTSPHRLGSQTPTLNGNAPNFLDKAIELYFLTLNGPLFNKLIHD